jgi:hypothetical protein
VNRVFAGNIALSEVERGKHAARFQVENVLHFFWSFCPDSTIEKIRVDQRRRLLVV